MRRKRLWVYKCNERDEPYQTAWGNWDDVFDKPEEQEWGGEWGIKSPASIHILRQEMRPRDLILSYQTDRKVAVGLCELTKLTEDQDGKRVMIVKPLLQFE